MCQTLPQADTSAGMPCGGIRRYGLMRSSAALTLNWDSQLRETASKASKLGSSVGLISSTFILRVRMCNILRLLCANARELGLAEPKDLVDLSALPQHERWLRKEPWREQAFQLKELKLQDLQEQLRLLSDDLDKFLYYVNGFPDSLDGIMDTTVKSSRARITLR